MHKRWWFIWAVYWLVAVAFSGAMLASAIHKAQAQDKATAIRCNASVVYDTQLSGTNVLVASPTQGSIFVCGYTMTTTSAVQAQLGWGTSTTAAVFTALTPFWQFNTTSAASTVLEDSSSAFRGLYVPAGNALLIKTSNAAQFQAVVYFFQEQGNR